MSNAKDAATEAVPLDSVRRCPKCGKEVSALAKFCFKCGTRLGTQGTSVEKAAQSGATLPSEGTLRSGSQPLKLKSPSTGFPIAELLKRHQVYQKPRELYFDLGIALLNRQDYVGAAKAFENALEESESTPETADILFHLAYVYELAGKGDHAFRRYLEAVLHAPEYLDAVLLHVHSLLSPDIGEEPRKLSPADIALTQSKWVTGEWAVDIAQIQITPLSRMHIALLIGRIHLYLANYTQALELFKEAMQVAPEVAPTMVGEILAPEVLPPALAASEKDGNASYLLAQLYYTFESYQLALQEVNRALELGLIGESSHPDAPALLLKAQLLEATGEPKEAARCFYEAGQHFYDSGAYESAVEQFSHAAELQADDARIYWYWADALLMCSYIPMRPYVERVYIEKGLNIWNKAIEIGLLDVDYAWVYISRARINEQLARLPNKDRWSLWWEAVIFLEMAILMGREDAYSWAHLSHFHRLLSNESNALHLTRLALNDEPDNRFAQEERVAILANVGKLSEAEEVINAYMEQERNEFGEVVKAYIIMRKGKERLEEALNLLNSVLKKDEKDIWTHKLRALCFKLQGNQSDALRDCRWVLDEINAPSDSDQMDDYGWAAYNLGKIDVAIECFETIIDDPSMDPGRICFSLGLCYLAQGKEGLERGEQLLRTGIGQMINTRQLNDIQLDLGEIERRSADWPDFDRAQLLEILKRLQQVIEKQRNRVKRLRTPQAELKQIIKKYPRDGKMGSWAWIAAHAGLARIYSEEDRWSEAAKTYQLLLKEAALFPEARSGLEKAIVNLQDKGNSYFNDRNFGRAAEQFSQALAFVLKSIPDNKMWQADLFSRLGFAYFNIADLSNAHGYFAKAIQLYLEGNNSDPGVALGKVCRSVLRDATQYWSLVDEWTAIVDNPETDEGQRNHFASARASLGGSLEELYHLSERYTDTSLPLPIILEIGEGLIPEDTSYEWSLFKFYIPKMRQRFQDRMGIEVPGVRVRSNYALPNNGYTIMLHENPVVINKTVPLNRRYCPNSLEVLQALGISRSDLLEAPHPLTGAPGCWIAPGDSEFVIGNHPELRAEEPLAYIIYHLEAVLRRNLSDFLGVQEVENLLNGWGKDESEKKLIASVLPDARAHFYLARVLRALVREYVPLTRWRNILEALQGSVLASGDIAEAIRAVRKQLKRWLPGNILNIQRLELPSNWEDRIARGLEHVNGETYFTPPPVETLEFLSMIRNRVHSSGENFVLITRNAKLRPFVRLLVEAEFPDLMVLSQEEILTHDELLAAQVEYQPLNEGVKTYAE